MEGKGYIETPGSTGSERRCRGKVIFCRQAELLLPDFELERI
jgi:hypothetical protein